MSRVFNISFPYGKSIYTALVTVKGNSENYPVSLRVEKEQIHLLLPHGKLSFPIKEVVNYFAGLQSQHDKNMVMPVTDMISLHLLSSTC
jgi:hypothetical protein